MAISDDIDGSPISYNITYADLNSGGTCGTFTIPATTCQDSVCLHTYQITSPCLPNEGIAISVLSTNILGSGPPSQPVIVSLIIDTEDHSKFLLIMHPLPLQEDTLAISNDAPYQAIYQNDREHRPGILRGSPIEVPLHAQYNLCYGILLLFRFDKQHSWRW